MKINQYLHEIQYFSIKKAARAEGERNIREEAAAHLVQQAQPGIIILTCIIVYLYFNC